MPEYKTIIFEEREGVALLTLNNPRERNPLTEETKGEIFSALGDVEKADGLRAVVITGKGPVFCAGGDVKKINENITPEESREVLQKSQQLLRRLVNLEKPVIAAVNGDAFGMGCNLVLATDFAVVSEKARFCEVFVKLGVLPDFGALYFLPRLIGLPKTKELAYMGKAITAEEALGMGLIHSVVPHEELEQEAMALAGRLAKMPTQAIGRMKRILNRSYLMTLDEVLEEEVEAQIYLSQTEDFREGIRAFREKRRPVFKGR